jgi:hypothetical protein
MEILQLLRSRRYRPVTDHALTLSLAHNTSPRAEYETPPPLLRVDSLFWERVYRAVAQKHV